MSRDLFANALGVAESSPLYSRYGKVLEASGLIILADGPQSPLGTLVKIFSGVITSQLAQIVGFRDGKTLIMPFGSVEGIEMGALIEVVGNGNTVYASDSLCGQVVDPFGKPLDGSREALYSETSHSTGRWMPLYADPPSAVLRRKISEVFDSGVRAINTLLTMGVGQRVGIMAGSGVGKSTLLGMIALHASSEINVICLVGERGREVREFIERDLGESGLQRSVVVVATGDQSALLRLRAAYLATAYAEFFRDQGKKVVLMLDSVTRLCMAQREIGLAVGEPPSTKGYTPSVFSMLPKLLERAGNDTGEGSITGIYTVLVEGDDMNEPIADATRGILDGHFVLSRELAGKGHFPALSVLESVSRLMRELVPKAGYDLASLAREVLATYKASEDLITIGAYKAGANPKVDRAVAKIEALERFLQQPPSEVSNMEDSWRRLNEIFTTP